MKKVWIGFLIGLMFIASVFGAEVKKHVRINLSGQPETVIVDFMKLHPDITSYGLQGEYVDVVATAKELEAMQRLGVSTEVLIDDIDAYTASLKQQGYFDAFHSYEEMLVEMQAVEAAYPTITRIHDIGDTWEKTQDVADRDIWAMKISDNVDIDEPDEPEVLYIALHHAREIITPEILLYFMNYLVDNYGTDPDVTYLVDNRQLWLVPNLNPDGHAVVFTGYDWRKNKRDNNENGQFDPSIDGVDLNRNYAYMWGCDNNGSSPDPSSWLYRGQAPFSEPETQAIRDLASTHNFVISLSYHSYGNLWLYPWAYIGQNTPDHSTFVEIADSCVAYNGYEPGNTLSGTIYTVNGDSDDWLYGEQTTKCKIFAFTPEVGGGADNFYPDTTRILPLILENLGPNLYVARAAEEFSEPNISYAGFSIEETTGDGDGILDPGESIELYLRLQNMGIGGVSGVNAVLETKDPDITIDDGEAAYYDMTCSAVSENVDDPFTISVSGEAVPHGVDFTLHVSGEQGTYETDIPFQLLIGQGTVLLVADDGDLGNKDSYIEVFNFLGIPYEVEEIQGMARSISEDLLDYSEVIWFTGPVESNTLTSEDQSTLEAFLEGGGRLLLSGGLIGYDIGDTPFYKYYLHARFVSFLTMLHHLNGAPSNPVVGETGITLSSTGSNAQGFAGETDPISPAVSIFNYDQTTEEGPGIMKSSGSGALTVETADYKVVYFSFGLEGIEPLEDRAQILANVLSWFKVPGIDKGDVDGNGTTNVLDVVISVNIVLGLYLPTEEEETRTDMNYDGQIDVVDIVQIVNAILGG